MPAATAHSDCLAGTYGNVAGLEFHMNCTYDLIGGVFKDAGCSVADRNKWGCFYCPAGYYCPNAGMTAPTECGAGYYSVDSSTSCTQCPYNYYCDNETTSFDKIQQC